MSAACDVLATAGLIRTLSAGKRTGRPASDFEVNPLLLKRGNGTMTDRNDDPVWRRALLPDGEKAMVATVEGKPRWSIEVIWPRETGWSIREFEADEAHPWTAGVLHLWNHGKTRDRRRLVLAFADGRWRSCRRARA